MDREEMIEWIVEGLTDDLLDAARFGRMKDVSAFVQNYCETLLEGMTTEDLAEEYSTYIPYDWDYIPEDE
jgi:hypothetical protein